MSGFATAATGLTTRPPSKNELLSWTRQFVPTWKPHRTLKVVLRFQARCPGGTWHTYWLYLHAEVARTVEKRCDAQRLLTELTKLIDYADPTGETAVANVMRGNKTQRQPAAGNTTEYRNPTQKIGNPK